MKYYPTQKWWLTINVNWKTLCRAKTFRICILRWSVQPPSRKDKLSPSTPKVSLVKYKVWDIFINLVQAPPMVSPISAHLQMLLKETTKILCQFKKIQINKPIQLWLMTLSFHPEINRQLNNIEANTFRYGTIHNLSSGVNLQNNKATTSKISASVLVSSKRWRPKYCKMAQK